MNLSMTPYIKNLNHMLLLVIIIPIYAFYVNSSCGDNICEKGFDRVAILINYTGFITTNNISTGQLINFNINNNEINFYLKLLAVDKTSKASTFDYNGTNISAPLNKPINLTNEVFLSVENLSIDIGNEEITCPNDCAQCTSNTDCDDKNLCTADSCEGSPKRCKHTSQPNCIGDAFKKLREKFTLSNASCKKEYKFISIDKIKKQIIFERTFPEATLNISYINKSTNQYGYLIELKEEILGKLFTYNLRYDENKSLLYLGEANILCPFVDACTSNKDCDDKDLCSIDECDGAPLRCKYKRIAYCKSGDGCCPARCNYPSDNDCINPNKCENALDCFDNDTCTVDICRGEPSLCQNMAIVDCTIGDNCCPSGCDYYQDQDCIRPITCGDNICEGNESATCCTDCSCSGGNECVNNTCIKPLIAQAGELLNRSIEIAKLKKELADKKFVLKDTLISKNLKGRVDFSYIFENKGRYAFINGTIDNYKVLVGEFQSPPRYNINYLYLIAVASAIILLGGGTGLVVHKKRKAKKREEYYARLLHQRYVMPQRRYTYHYPRHHAIHQRQYQQMQAPQRTPIYPSGQQYPYQRRYPQQQYQQQMWRR